MRHGIVTNEARRELVSYLDRRTNDHALAEDLAHDAIVRLIDYGRTRETREPRALLFRIADNLLVSTWRRRKLTADQELTDQLEDQNPDPERQLVARDSLNGVRRVLENMPPKRREVLIRRRLHGESYDAIGRAMGLSRAAVEKHMTRAVVSLREATAKDDGAEP